MKNIQPRARKINPITAITESIIANGRIDNQILPYETTDKIKKALRDKGYEVGLSLTKPDNHFTGIQAGTTFYLWAVPPFQYKRLTDNGS